MVITCQQCGALISAHAGHCAQCGGALDPGQHAHELKAIAAEVAQPRPRIERPAGLAVEESVGGAATLTIVRHPRRRVVPFFLSAVALVGIFGLWVYDALSYASVILALVLVPVTAVVLLVFRSHLVAMLERSVVHATPDRLTVRHTPVGTPLADEHIDAADVVQLFSMDASKIGRPGIGRYQVKALLSGAVTLVLVDGLGTPEEALFIEQKLESLWRLADREVAGELPRGSGDSSLTGYQLTDVHPKKPRAARFVPSFLVVLILCALPAAAIALVHTADTFEVEVRDDPTTLTFDVSEGRPAVRLFSDVNIELAGGLRPVQELPSFSYAIQFRRRGANARAPVEVSCDATHPDRVGWHTWRRGELIQYASWHSALADCPVELEPGAWEAEAVRRWRSRGRKGDVVHKSKLRIQAKRW